MESDVWYETFTEILYKKFPKKTQLIQALMDLLSLEREAVYRRLRKEVIFSAFEIIKIASAWNISFDEIINVNSGQVAFQMYPVNYLDPSPNELIFLRGVIRTIYYLQNLPDTETMHICNKFPRDLVSGFPYLNLFYLFKWVYEYSNEKEIFPLSKIMLSKDKIELEKDYYNAVKVIPNVNMIFDCNIFSYFIDDVLYFCSIQLITDNEKELIKRDLLALLDYLLEVANKGCYPETENKVNLYISQLNIDTNYSYIWSPEINACFVHAFEKYEIHSFNSEMTTNFKSWMNLKKRTSVQISEVDERSRIEFFTKQRQLVENF